MPMTFNTAISQPGANSDQALSNLHPFSDPSDPQELVDLSRSNQDLPLERPASPSSIEDSQSESGLDTHSVDTVDTDPSAFGSLPVEVHTEDLNQDNSDLSIAHLTVEPLVLSIKADLEVDSNMEAEVSQELAQEINADMEQTGEQAGAGTLDEAEQGQPYDLSTEQETDADPADESAALQSHAPHVPKHSAWSTLLPGVAPIPIAPPTPAFVSRPTISNELRLHELLPIVLPHEHEAKLSMEMIDLFENLLPTEESHERRTKLIQKIENILELEWPGQDIQAHPFGSTVNDLGTSSSDVDICITTTWPGLKNVQMLASAFRKHGMQKVFCVPRAKVPIVKFWDPELHLSCDMNINTPLGLLNTRMIKTYVSIDPRVRPFAMIIKHWARRRVLNDAANGGTISTYTWICIVINFLQMRSPPILPALHQMEHPLSEDNQVINGNNTSFFDDLSKLEGFGFENKETLGGLLYAFFRRFAIEFDYDNHVISVREGRYLTKESKGWHIPGKQYKMFCVEEPMDTSRNLGNSSDMASCKGLKEEFRRALDILHQKVSLNLCCAQWVFPPSYYHSNHRSGTNGTASTNNYAGRRYANGYRNNYYYDDRDYDDDDEEDAVSEISVMETLNIGTRPSTRMTLGNSSTRQNSSAGKEGSPSGTSRSDRASQGSQPGNRLRQSKPGQEGSGGEAGRSGSSRSPSKQDKTSATGSSPRNRRVKSSGGHGEGNGQKGGRSNGGGNGGRAPRAAVEFSLADIASVAPKLTKGDQGSSGASGENGTESGSGEGGQGSKQKRKGRRNVVWSTNSNRGESSRKPAAAAAKATNAPLEQEKAKSFVADVAEGSVDKVEAGASSS